MLVSLFLSLLLSSFLSVPPQGSANIARTGEQKLFFIDVSQSVEHDHPASFDFLRTLDTGTPWVIEKNLRNRN